MGLGRKLARIARHRWKDETDTARALGPKALARLEARVAALELGSKGIRVNTIHPNAVFDTGLWTDEVLAQRASSYQLSVDEYKKNNVLGRSVGSRDVARLAALMAGEGFACTTGAQVPVDGGSTRCRPQIPTAVKGRRWSP